MNAGTQRLKVQTELSAWQRGLIFLLNCSTAAARVSNAIFRTWFQALNGYSQTLPYCKVGIGMNTQIRFESATRQSTRRFSFRILALVGIWLILVSIYAMFVIAVATAKVSNAFIDAAIFSGAILCASLDRSRIAQVVAVSIPLFGLAEWLRVPALSAALLMLGCGGVIILAYYAASGNQVAEQNFQIAVLLPLFVVLTNTVNDKIAHLTPHLFDAALLRADCGISAAIRHWTLARPLRLAITNVLYGALPLAASGVIAYTTGRDRSQLLRALCFAALLAVPCYLLLPAVGPAYIGQPLAPRNCMPSLHVTWAALLWLNAQPVWLRRAAFCFMLITAFTTLATGEHYVLDLVAAVPFTWIVQQLSEATIRLHSAVRE